MAQGTIKRLTNYGFGFIDPGTGRELFFHHSALVGVSFSDLHAGDPVEFDRERDPRGEGNQTVNVRRMNTAQRPRGPGE